jgi:hypothetical protein
MVLVAYRMGGLIAKLQVTYSDGHVGSRLANRPLEEIVTTESIPAFLAETCYFDPSPAGGGQPKLSQILSRLLEPPAA